ncbi:MAG: restriction endonuclease subunit S [Elusimicrobiota bacterium]
MVEWKPIEELFDFEKGTLQSSKCTEGKYTFITAAEEWKTHREFTHDCEALVFAMAASGSLGRTHYIKGKFISSDLCFILTPKKGLKLDLSFYHRLFNSLRQNIVKKTATGTSKLAINRTNFGKYRLPYFDYEHQLSFRDKIESISTINEEFSDGVSEQILFLNKLRQTFLQEAVEGKLTTEWRNQNPELITGDNHASKLLEIINIEKERLIKEGKIRKAISTLPITESEKPFDLPEGWLWCRLGELVKKITDGTHFTPQYRNEGIKFVSAKDIKMGYLTFDKCRYISKEAHEELFKRCNPELNDLIVSKSGSIGTVVLNQYAYEFSLFESLALIKYIQDKIIPGYFKHALQFVCNNLKREDIRGVAVKHLHLEVLRTLLVALPPITEQQVIVERIGKLMKNIDELEKQVIERKNQSEMLMQSVLIEAFNM